MAPELLPHLTLAPLLRTQEYLSAGVQYSYPPLRDLAGMHIGDPDLFYQCLVVLDRRFHDQFLRLIRNTFPKSGLPSYTFKKLRSSTKLKSFLRIHPTTALIVLTLPISGYNDL